MPNDLRDVAEDLEVDWRSVQRSILISAADRIGRVATTKFMRPGGGPGDIGRNTQEGPGSLRIGTGRLARSITGKRTAGAGSVRGAPEGIFDLSPTKGGMRLTYGSKVDYAAIHEYGGEQVVTDRQRGFFWHKYSQTGKDKWKAMALSERLDFPERSYLREALKDQIGEVETIAEDEVIDALFGAGGG